MPECCTICNETVEMYNGQGFGRGRLVWQGRWFFGGSPTGMKIIFKTGRWGGDGVIVWF
jgi:hypothetical protein